MLSVTVSIIILTCLISFAAFNSSKITDDLIFWPPAINMRHQYYRFITCGLIHADFLHLGFNMITLYFFGRGAELLYSGELGLRPFYYPLLYITALVVSNIPSYIKRRDDYSYRSLGASGAVCAVMFAVILIRPWDQLYIFGRFPIPAILYAVLFLAFSFYMSKRGGDNVNHDAHMWGALYGVVFTVLAHPDIAHTFLNEMKNPRF